MSSITIYAGHLRADSPLRRAFPAGIVPIASGVPVKREVDFPEGSRVEEVYLVDVAACSDLERQMMASIWAEAGQGTLLENLAYINDTPQIPVRTSNFTGIGFAPREAGR